MKIKVATGLVAGLQLWTITQQWVRIFCCAALIIKIQVLLQALLVLVKLLFSFHSNVNKLFDINFHISEIPLSIKCSIQIHSFPALKERRLRSRKARILWLIWFIYPKHNFTRHSISISVSITNGTYSWIVVNAFRHFYVNARVLV